MTIQLQLTPEILKEIHYHRYNHPAPLILHAPLLRIVAEVRGALHHESDAIAGRQRHQHPVIPEPDDVVIPVAIHLPQQAGMIRYLPLLRVVAIINEKPARIAPTHFGIFEEVEWQLREVEKGLDSAARWLEATMSEDPAMDMDALRQSFTEWMLEEGVEMGLSEDVVKAYELANPLGMSADGLLRYWKKVKLAG